jgi:hypothetical protein
LSAIALETENQKLHHRKGKIMTAWYVILGLAGLVTFGALIGAIVNCVNVNRITN